MKKKDRSRSSNGASPAEYNAERVRDGPQKPYAASEAPDSPWQAVTEYLEKLRFRRQIFGGVSEADVWRRLDEINRMYEEALRAERIRYDVLLKQQQQQPSQDEGGAENE